MTPETLQHYREIRHQIHRHPELGFEEHATSALVANHLRALGLDLETGIGGTGVVATIRKGRGGKTIGLRADMDALPMSEQNDLPYRSRVDNCFHGCGHDGHTTMLLAAAELLANSARFDGTVHLIFQPAEEGLGGANAMIQAGLFERFPCDSIFGMHNMPRLPVGQFAVRSGPFFAAADSFRIVLRGKGGHAAMPHTTADPIVAAAHIITALQTLVSRNTDPLHSAVFTVGQIQAGLAHNIIPETVELKGSARFLDSDVQSRLTERFRVLVDRVAAALEVSVENFTRENTFPVLVNAEKETRQAIRSAVAVAGAGNVNTNAEPIMGSEDFAFMLQQVPGCYVLIGNGGGESACMIHNPHYDFNDQIIPLGAAYWVNLAESLLPI